MSTKCRIGIKNEDGTITSIYCYNDGYLSYVGKILVDHYKDAETINKLMELGNMSSLGTEPVSNPRAWNSLKELSECLLINDGGKSYYDKYLELHPKNMCETYKTRGDEGEEATTNSLDETIIEFNASNQEYLYLFKDDEWYYIESGAQARDFKCVSEELKKLERSI